MLPATRGIAKRADAGNLLPDVFLELAREGIHFRRSQLSMIVGGPGVGKSVLATLYAAKAGIGALYFSADTDPHTMTCRLAAASTGDEQQVIDAAIRDGVGKRYLDAVDDLDRLLLCFDPSPSVNDILDEVDAYAMLTGEYPELIVVDNLMDVYADAEEHKAQKETLDSLHELARSTGAHVMVLHHATGEFENGDEPIPLKGTSNKLGKKPTLILTMHRVHDQWADAIGVCPVKHRNGRADSSGRWVIWMPVDMARMTLGTPVGP